MSKTDLDQLISEAKDRNWSEHQDTTRLLVIADRYAALARVAEIRGDLRLARRRLDKACDAEGEALGDCEGYGWPREMLGDQCPWEVTGHYEVASGDEPVLRLVVESRCTHDYRCHLKEGDTVRSWAGRGAVHMVLLESPLIVADHCALCPAVVCTWIGPIPSIIWKTEGLARRPRS